MQPPVPGLIHVILQVELVRLSNVIRVRWYCQDAVLPTPPPAPHNPGPIRLHISESKQLNHESGRYLPDVSSQLHDIGPMKVLHWDMCRKNTFVFLPCHFLKGLHRASGVPSHASCSH